MAAEQSGTRWRIRDAQQRAGPRRGTLTVRRRASIIAEVRMLQSKPRCHSKKATRWQILVGAQLQPYPPPIPQLFLRRRPARPGVEQSRGTHHHAPRNPYTDRKLAQAGDSKNNRIWVACSLWPHRTRLGSRLPKSHTFTVLTFPFKRFGECHRFAFTDQIGLFDRDRTKVRAV